MKRSPRARRCPMIEPPAFTAGTMSLRSYPCAFCRTRADRSCLAPTGFVVRGANNRHKFGEENKRAPAGFMCHNSSDWTIRTFGR